MYKKIDAIAHKTMAQLERDELGKDNSDENYIPSEMIYVTNPLFNMTTEDQVGRLYQTIDEDSLTQFREVNREKELLADNVSDINHNRIRLIKQNEHLDKEIEKIERRIKYFEDLEAKKGSKAQN